MQTRAIASARDESEQAENGSWIKLTIMNTTQVRQLAP